MDGQAGTTVRVDALLTERGFEVLVVDSGPGVPADQRERIFDPFLQIEGAQRPLTRGGRGLGLAFCKKAVEAHGGSIAIEDGAPGAIFRVTIPT